MRAEIRGRREHLKTARSAAEPRALLAILIARIYALPLPRVLALRRDEIAVTPISITLWPDADALTLGEPIAGAFRRWIAWSSA